MASDRATSRQRIILAVIGAVVFAGTLFLYPKVGLFVSPDETANAFFAQRFADTGTLYVHDTLNATELSDALHPRSVRSLRGNLVPESFLGLPVLYGAAISALGDWALPFLTAVIALAAVFAWYATVSKLFSRRIGFYSALLLVMHPAWWYFSARALMHNVLFASLLIFGAWCLVSAHLKERKWSDAQFFAGGGLIGFALFVRASEVFWVGLALMIVWLFERRRVGWKRTVLCFAGFVTALLPMFALNIATYGDAFATGYTYTMQVERPPLTPPYEGGETQVNPPPSQGGDRGGLRLIFPFGFDLRATAKNVWHYGIALHPWMSVLVVGGFGVVVARLLRRTERQEKKTLVAYLTVFLFVCFWLAVMYGSWTFADHPDPSEITIGNSHVRYWIPIFILYTPLAAWLLEAFLQNVRTAWSRGFITVVVFAAAFGWSAWTVFLTPGDGLIDLRKTLDRSQMIRQKVFLRTEPESVIITDRADKLFFPYRRVRQPLRDEYTYALMPRILEHVPLYYYGVTFPAKDFEYLNRVKLKERGLHIELMETFDAESLYRILP